MHSITVDKQFYITFTCVGKIYNINESQVEAQVYRILGLRLLGVFLFVSAL